MNLIQPYKERKIDYDKPVRVYRNLNKKGVWYSLVQNKKTVAHTSGICLVDCIFIVNEKTRKRVVKNKKKEFHAYIEGYIRDSICGTDTKRNDLPAIIKYNPYINNGFICSNLTTNPFIVKKARFVICNEVGVRAAHIEK